MELIEAAAWAYRLFLNREAESRHALSHAVSSASDLPGLRRLLTVSREYASLLDRAGAPFTGDQIPGGRSTSVDLAAAVTWGFRFFLGREPLEAEMSGTVANSHSLNDVRLAILLSPECEGAAPDLEPLKDFSIANAFAPFPDRKAVHGAFTDFLGNVTRIDFVGNAWAGRAGYVYGSVPRDAEAGLHGTSEWVGTLRSVLEAQSDITVVELGAGWAPWLVVASRAASLRGIARVDLTAVEGSSEHFGYIADNFGDNGLIPAEHDLHHAVVAAQDGVALFPKLNFSDDYGASAVFEDNERAAAANRGDLEEIRALSLETLLRGKTRVDLMHIDIQGHELDVVRSGLATLSGTVRRMVIGTHSRAIDGALIDLLQGAGWRSESLTPCELVRMPDGRLLPGTDGEQVWRNDAVPALNPLLSGTETVRVRSNARGG